MRTDYIVYEGYPIKGKPAKVYQRGNLLVDGEEWHGKNGNGQFIARKPNAPVL
jgi:dihydropyrimidinase